EQMKERSERLSISSSSSHSSHSQSSGSGSSPALSYSSSKRLTDPHHHLHLASDGIAVGGMHDLTNIPHSAPASAIHVSGGKETPGEVESLRTRVGEEENETKVKLHDDSRS